ncbi:WD40-repeat-containing domain protein [Linnemannia elongata]|nr:WD40-repeat-containing domain protein [Linnemannia elongata]
MSPGLPHVQTPGPPPLKDSSGSNRQSDPYAQYGPPPSIPHQYQQHQEKPSGFRSLSRANSHYSQDEGSQSPSAVGSSAGFSSLFGGKRKKPKNNIAKTNSTFVSKITTNENLAKILANRMNEDVYIFWNTGRTFTWSDLNQKPNPLSHITFSKAFPTSHDVNVLTRSCDHLDVIIGFSTGDIIWFDPLCNKYYRLNKQGIIKDSPVTMIKWLPGSESQFMVAFQDGSIVIMDKERDDQQFTAHPPTSDTMFHVTHPKHGKHNPISHWQVSKKPITAFAFSPDLQHVAVVAMDGALRIIDFRDERLLDTFSAYFGALTCVCWSPDGKYVLTGGQDDLVTIWSFKDQRIVARCQGHQSYVTGVAFDPWRCGERNYRFGSVGEDAKLLLWDFSVGALHKPKADDRQSLKSGHGFSSLFRHQHKAHGGVAQGMQVVRPPEPRSHVAMLQPLMAKGIHQEPLAGITFREDAIMTSDRRGHIKVWKRPPLLPHQQPPPPPAHQS